MFRPWEVAASRVVQNKVVDTEVQSEEKQLRHRFLTSDAKKIVKSVYNSLLKKECSAPLKVTSEIVGVPYSTVRSIIENKSTARKLR